MGDFDHIREAYRAKVAGDFLAHLDLRGGWDQEQFDPANDYQRHLYALFLKLAGRSLAQVYQVLMGLAQDVPNAQKRGRYVLMVLHSEIVGFPFEDGSLLEIPNQNITRMEFPSLA